MPNRTLILKVLYTASTVAGTMLVGLPVYAQVSGTGTVIPATNTLPVISVPGASPAYLAATAAPPNLATPLAFTNWVTSNAAVQVSGPVSPGAEGDSVFVVYRFFVTDADGHGDIQSADVKLLNPDGSVHTAYAPAYSLGSSSAITNEYYTEFELKYFDAPATGTNFYKIVVQVADAAQAQTSSHIDSLVAPKMFQYSELASLQPGAAVIDFGNLQVGTKSDGIPITLTNLGNVPADSTLSADDLVNGASTISAAKIWYGPTDAAEGTNFPVEGANAKRDAGFNLAPADSHIVYLAVDVPAGTPTGIYTTTINFNGVQHTGAACTSDCATVSWS
jgi:hypothetical protein